MSRGKVSVVAMNVDQKVEATQASRSRVDRFIQGLHKSQDYVTRKLSCIPQDSPYTIQTAPPDNIVPEAMYGTTARLAAVTEP